MKKLIIAIAALLQACSAESISIDGLILNPPSDFTAAHIQYAVDAVKRVQAVLPQEMKDGNLRSIKLVVNSDVPRARTTTRSSGIGGVDAIVRINISEWKIHLEHELVHAFGGIDCQPSHPFAKEGLAEYFGALASPFRAEKELLSLMLCEASHQPMSLTIRAKGEEVFTRMDHPAATRTPQAWASIESDELDSASLSRSDYAAAHVAAIHCASEIGVPDAMSTLDIATRTNLGEVAHRSLAEVREEDYVSAYYLRACIDALSSASQPVRRELAKGRIPAEVQLAIVDGSGNSHSLTQDRRFLEILDVMTH